MSTFIIALSKEAQADSASHHKKQIDMETHSSLVQLNFLMTIYANDICHCIAIYLILLLINATTTTNYV